MADLKQQIILVDDNKINTLVLKMMLRKWEDLFAFAELENASGLLQLINESEYRKILVFLDLQMPIMDGYTFLNIWEKEKQYSNKQVSIVVVSATELSVFKKDGPYQLLQDYLMKPVDAEELENAMNTFINVK